MSLFRTALLQYYKARGQRAGPALPGSRGPGNDSCGVSPAHPCSQKPAIGSRTRESQPCNSRMGPTPGREKAAAEDPKACGATTITTDVLFDEGSWGDLQPSQLAGVGGSSRRSEGVENNSKGVGAGSTLEYSLGAPGRNAACRLVVKPVVVLRQVVISVALHQHPDKLRLVEPPLVLHVQLPQHPLGLRRERGGRGVRKDMSIIRNRDGILAWWVEGEGATEVTHFWLLRAEEGKSRRGSSADWRSMAQGRVGMQGREHDRVQHRVVCRVWHGLEGVGGWGDVGLGCHLHLASVIVGVEHGGREEHVEVMGLEIALASGVKLSKRGVDGLPELLGGVQLVPVEQGGAELLKVDGAVAVHVHAAHQLPQLFARDGVALISEPILSKQQQQQKYGHRRSRSWRGIVGRVMGEPQRGKGRLGRDRMGEGIEGAIRRQLADSCRTRSST